MRIIKHTFQHTLVHLALFSGFAIMVPVISKSIELSTNPFSIDSTIMTAGFMLVLVSAIMLYKLKENLPNLLESLGATIFLPGALSLISGVTNLTSFLEGSSISGMAVIKPVADFYLDHSVPTVLSVAAVYLFVGGVLYWIGSKMNNVKEKFSFR